MDVSFVEIFPASYGYCISLLSLECTVWTVAMTLSVGDLSGSFVCSSGYYTTIDVIIEHEHSRVLLQSFHECRYYYHCYCCRTVFLRYLLFEMKDTAGQFRLSFCNKLNFLFLTLIFLLTCEQFNSKYIRGLRCSELSKL